MATKVNEKRELQEIIELGLSIVYSDEDGFCKQEIALGCLEHYECCGVCFRTI